MDNLKIFTSDNCVLRKDNSKTDIFKKIETHAKTLEPFKDVSNKSVISIFNTKSRSIQKSVSEIYNSKENIEIQEKNNSKVYSVCISKSERKSNITEIRIKSSVNKKISKTLGITNEESSKNILEYSPVQGSQFLCSSTENVVTPKNLIPVIEKKIKVDHQKKNKHKVQENKSDSILDPNLTYNLEYQDNFIDLQLELDTSHKLSPTFMMKGISNKERKSAIKNLLKFASTFNYPTYATFQSIRIADAMIDAKSIDCDQIDLINFTALWITLKRIYLFDNIPSARKILSQISSENPQKKLLYDCEKDILITLNFEISFPDPISMVVLCLRNVDDDYPSEIMYYTAHYFIELSLLNEYFSRISISSLVIAISQISLFISIKAVEGMKHPPWHFWRSSFPKSLWSKQSISDIELESIRKKLIRTALLSQNPESDYDVVFEKYNSKASKFGRVSKLIAKRLNALSECEYN